MKWSLLELRKYQEEPLTFSQTIDLKEKLRSRDASILDIKPVLVDGLITVSKSEYVVHYKIITTITVPSTRSLTPVSLPLKIEVDEVFMTPEQYQQRTDLIPEEDILVLENDVLDLYDSIEDNILLAIPTKVLTEAELHSTEFPKGEGWEVISEEDYQQREAEATTKLDPRLAKLSELLQDSSEETDDR